MRIVGINIPDNKNIEISLTYIYGIGNSLARKLLQEANIPLGKKTKDLTAEEISRLRDLIEKDLKIEGDLREEIRSNIKRLKEINCWRGLRHQKGLPVRGQRTRCNSRTVRGNVRRTVGSGRKPPPAPK
ncbi:MAG: 30S ribosomal protein S13 [Candidatus Pacebacteria bacterium]|nr:30S ribosomal protein S13 [Candidatus Paceibacterota bacterium]